MHVSQSTFSKWLGVYGMKWNSGRFNAEVGLKAFRTEQAAGSKKGMSKVPHNHAYRSACRLKPGGECEKNDKFTAQERKDQIVAWCPHGLFHTHDLLDALTPVEAASHIETRRMHAMMTGETP